MVAQLWAKQITDGNATYSEVPRLLRDRVREILIKSGRSDLVTT